MLEIPRYQLEKQIGAGSMGVVFSALDRLTGQRVAVKLVTSPTQQLHSGQKILHFDNASRRLALAQEFRMLASLHHPHIISVLDYGFGKNQYPYFAMEYLPDAQNLIQAALNQPQEVQARLLCQVLQALDYLHRCGVLHRDLKPSNILVQSGHVRVVDFGLSVLEGGEQGRAGTLAYMAPEFLRKGRAEAASDLYAVGVIAYQIFSGKLPFDANDSHAILNCAPDLDAIQGSPKLRQFVGKLLQKDPYFRYPDARTALFAISLAVGLPMPEENQDIRESYLQAARFVGRDAEMQKLLQALKMAKEGQGGVWLVDGESGVGKTRLFDELRTHALVSGATVLRGHAKPQDSSPYQLWREPMRQLALTTPLTDVQLAALERLIPDLATIMGHPILPLMAVEVLAMRNQLAMTIVDVIQFAAHTTPPLVVILEDLQWASAGLEPLTVFARMAREWPLLVLANYRSDETPELSQILPNAHRLTLPRLDEEKVAQLSSAMLGPDGGKPEVVQWLMHETEGNILFLVETVRALAEEAGRLEQVVQNQLPESFLAQGVQQILQYRLDKMPPAGRPLLNLAAIAGRELDLTLLSALNTDMDLDAWLTVGSSAAILQQMDDRWQFSHDKLRETLIERLEPSTRTLLYRQVATTCDQLYPQDDAMAAMLSVWWRQAEIPEKEFQSACRAGKYAIIQQFYSQAEGFIARALELCPPDAVAERYELLFDLEKIHQELGKYDGQAADLNKLEALAGQITLEQRLDVQILRARYEFGSQNYPVALGIIEKIAQTATELDDRERLASIELLWGQLYTHQAAYDKAAPHFEKAIALFKAAGNLHEEGSAIGALSTVYYDLGDSKWIQLNDRAVTIFHSLGDKVNEARGLSNHGNYLDDQGERSRALEYYSRALELLKQTGHRSAEVIVLLNIGYVYERLGIYKEAFKYVWQGWQILVKIGNANVEIGALTILASICFSQKQLGDALHYAEKALAMGKSLGIVRLEIPTRVMLGHILIAMKQLDEAEKVLLIARDLCEQTGYARVVGDLWNGFARLALARADRAQALVAVEQIMLLCQTDPSLMSYSDEPMRVFSTCYAVLHTNRDKRAFSVLRDAYEQLTAHAAKITDPSQRQTFLEKVQANLEIIILWQNQTRPQNL